MFSCCCKIILSHDLISCWLTVFIIISRQLKVCIIFNTIRNISDKFSNLLISIHYSHKWRICNQAFIKPTFTIFICFHDAITDCQKNLLNIICCCLKILFRHNLIPRCFTVFIIISRHLKVCIILNTGCNRRNQRPKFF